MNNYELILNIALSKSLLSKAIKIAFVVGIILNLINQGEQIINLHTEKINFLKLCFTFIVPFCVSMYTAVSMKLKFHVGEKSPANTKLKCKACNKCINIKKEEIIPFCKTCKDKTVWKVISTKDSKC